jgi:hypothetical protein
MLADQGGAVTGEWLPQTVVDGIGRFSHVIETKEATAWAETVNEQGSPGRTTVNGARWRKWRWPVVVVAALLVVAVVAIILAASRGGAATYASDPLGTGSPQVTARVYFGQLKAITSALAGQVTFNTPAAFVDDEPSQCSLTVVFTGVANPTGAVYASGLDSGWQALEYAPSQTTVKGGLHEQIVTPGANVSAGKSWLVSAVLVAGSQRLTSDEYSLKFQGGAGGVQTWLIDGQAVSCHG